MACWMLEKGRHQSDTEDNISNCLKVISDLNVDLQVWGGAERECPLHKLVRLLKCSSYVQKTIKQMLHQ